MKYCFTVSYYLASNGLVERTNRKILEILRPVVGELLEMWEDWLPHIAASKSSRVCESKGQSPHFIVFGVEKRLPYLLSSSHTLIYNVANYVKSKFSLIFTSRSKTNCDLLILLCITSNTSEPPRYP